MRALLARLQRPGSRIALALFFTTAGVLHFIFPRQYSATIPPWLPAHGALVVISGVCEIAGALGLLVPPLRRAAGMGLLLLCLAVLPANVQMWLAALDADKAFWIQLLLLLRLPLQIPLMVWIWQAARGARFN
jgi:uncharacterized membrane protein